MRSSVEGAEALGRDDAQASAHPRTTAQVQLRVSMARRLNETAQPRYWTIIQSCRPSLLKPRRNPAPRIERALPRISARLPLTGRAARWARAGGADPDALAMRYFMKPRTSCAI